MQEDHLSHHSRGRHGGTSLQSQHVEAETGDPEFKASLSYGDSLSQKGTGKAWREVLVLCSGGRGLA